MPFVEPGKRARLDQIVELMAKFEVNSDGELNYILFKYGKWYLHNIVGYSYRTIKSYKSELRECADIINTEILTPYEQKKKAENGDITE